MNEIKLLLLWLKAYGGLQLFLGLILACFFGVRIEMTKSSEIKGERISPIGRIEIVGSKNEVSSDYVNVWSYTNLYRALGVTSERFIEWEDKYGMDSLGVGMHAEILAKGYPIFSKVAWMHIDPVELSEAETSELIRECKKAMQATDDDSAREVLGQIRQLGLKALSLSAALRFGHP